MISMGSESTGLGLAVRSLWDDHVIIRLKLDKPSKYAGLS